ncbi:MAG: 2Fe-2S iron-sulfur cluster-binding protein, partial [Pseudomonadota bacterium]
MSKQEFRLDDGGTIDRTSPIEFSFDLKRIVGFAGDTIASALLANGIHLVGRSFKYHRPRGILSAGPEEPSALVRVNRGHGRVDPNQRATEVELVPGLSIESQNRWPSLEWDVGQISELMSPLLPAGFYYKTFKWPASAWRFYEENIRRMAGLGRAPTEADRDRYAHRYEHCEILIVGGGLAGLSAALQAARTGVRVILADDQTRLGGWMGAVDRDDTRGLNELVPSEWVERAAAELAAFANVRVLQRTRAFAYYDHNLLGLLERVTDHFAEPAPKLPRERLWKVRARSVILATGAIERPLLFANNDRPGILLADAAYRYVTRYAVVPGKNIVLCTNNDSAYESVWALAERGVLVQMVIDYRSEIKDHVVKRMDDYGIPIRRGAVVRRAYGQKRIRAVAVEAFGRNANSRSNKAEHVNCDALLVSGGWNPNVALFAQS